MNKSLIHLRDRADRMSDDQLLFLFVPEILAVRKEAIEKSKDDMVEMYDSILAYIKPRIEIFTMSIPSWPEPKIKLVVPSPDAIINGKSESGIPNN